MKKSSLHNMQMILPSFPALRTQCMKLIAQDLILNNGHRHNECQVIIDKSLIHQNKREEKQKQVTNPHLSTASPPRRADRYASCCIASKLR